MPPVSTISTPRPSARERLAGLRNFQSKDFWAMVFARPLTILFLLPIADLAWVTPNLLTLSSILAKVAGIASLVWWPSYAGAIAGAVLVNLGLVLDNMDGTLARYRNLSTYAGYYVDKASDIVCLAGIFGAVAYRAFSRSAALPDLVLPLAAFAGASIAAYCKWVAQHVSEDIDLLEGLQAGKLEEYARRRTVKNPCEAPPDRTFRDWIAFLFQAVKSILYFNEVDIYFFLGLALLLDREWLFTRTVCPVYAFGMIAGPVHFYFKLKNRLKKSRLA
jgi:phosphatidylglycerophosphate synthase